MQFTVGQDTVHSLVVGMTSTLLIMPIRIVIHTPILATLTLFQLELPTVLQSWLEPVSSHLTRLRYFISLESRCLFYSHARRNHQNSKKNYTSPPPKKKITLKHIAKQRASESLNISITLRLIHIALVYYLNWTARTYARGGLWHDLKLSASIVVFNRYPGHQKQMYLNLAITDFPDYFTRFGATMVPNTGLARDAHRSPICVYIWFTRPHEAYLNRVCPSTLKNA